MEEMTVPVKTLVRMAMLAAVLLNTSIPSALADIRDYAFEAVPEALSPGHNRVLRVRLLRLADGEPVSGATILGPRLGMWAPSQHKAIGYWMNHVVGPAVAEGDGVYRFAADLPMPGNYHLSLTAQVAGDPEPVSGRARFRIER